MTRLISLALVAGALLAQTARDPRAAMLEKMDAAAKHYGDLSRQIWELAELGYRETRSVALLRAELERAGFRIEDRVAGIPTAFVATWGAGKPVIGILGEYDALPGLAQEDAPEKEPRAGPGGHGCGHNLLGTASAFAAIAVKNYLADHRLAGTIRFYGTPAEEGGGGKIYMARAGAFRDADVILTWHPGGENRADTRSCLAILAAKFRFYGKAAHAGTSPDKGRSALDAVLLMSHAVEMLREHVPDFTRIHSIITQGGSAPNIVPDFAEAYYFARHPEMSTLDGIWERILKCAQAGALATETRMEMELVNSSYNILPNDALASALYRNLQKVGGVRYTREEQAFAEALRKTFPTENSLPLGSQEGVLPPQEGFGTASTDFGDVSWMLPAGEFTAATYVPGTPGHSWQSTACSGMSIGRKGMVVAAKTLALTAVDLFSDPKLVEAARASFEKRRAGREYRSRIPPDHQPPLDYRGK